MKCPQRSICGPNGFDVVPGPWVAPETISKEVSSLAQVELVVAEHGLLYADEQSVRWWLMALGPLVASNMTADDARFKVNAFCSVLMDFPMRIAVSRESLNRAARKFQFWPTFKEINDFWEREEQKLKEEVRRLRVLAKGQEYRPEEQREDRKRGSDLGEKLGELVAAISDKAKMDQLAKSAGLKTNK